MNQKNNNLEFNKSANKNSNDNSSNNQRNVAIKKIMDKYGLSFHEANKILIHLEKEEKVKNNSKGSLKNRMIILIFLFLNLFQILKMIQLQ